MNLFDRSVLMLAGLFAVPDLLRADEVLDPKMHHLRSGEEREWSEFPEAAEGKRLDVNFATRANTAEKTLRLRHRDVKQTWDVKINDRKLASLVQDENATVTFLAIPAHTLREGENVVSIMTTPGGASDDVEIGDVHLLDRGRDQVVSEARLKVEVRDRETGRAIPSRITIVDRTGALVTLGTVSNEHFAVRPGVVYTATGTADIRLPAGKYTLYATRGFEWGLDQVEVELAPGETFERRLSIRREVPTPGYIAVDPHCHTFTYSRHGDATLAERVIAIAGEGIELPVATDHNLYASYDAAARAANVRSFFTPVVGNEVTTASLGHFNVFPVPDGAKPMNARAPDTELLFRTIEAAAPEAVVVLNHARDVHGGFRPFDPKHYVSLTGQTLSAWKPRFNAMEVINSGATRTDALGLVHDWMGLLNAGRHVSPIGASDSHDVSRYIVGQGRTYVRCDDGDVGKIDVAAASRSLREGRVLVSYGLLADIKVNDGWTAGDTAAANGEVDVEVRVLGPAWTTAERVTLYANGVAIREAAVGPDGGNTNAAGVKFRNTWTLPRPAHDVHLVAVATGPGVTAPHWPCAKPYQPTSPDFTPYVLGVSGAVYLDADASGAFDSAHEYARRVVEQAGPAPAAVAAALAAYDSAVAAQGASVVWERNADAFATYMSDGVKSAPPHVRTAFEAFHTAVQLTLPPK